jgi:hypothetical protein
VNLCIKGDSSTDYIYYSRGNAKRWAASETALYGGLYFGERHAFHLSGRYFYGQALAKDKMRERDLSTQYAVYQYGKLYHDPVQISIGRQRLPFGVERQPLVGFFSLHQPYAFWAGPDLGINLTVSNTRSFFFQLGLFTELKDPEEGKGLKTTSQAFTARIFYDKPSWQGSKVILSLYGDRSENQRVGIALLNSSADERIIQLEFIRSFYNGKFWHSNFTQLLRLWLQSARVRNWQYFFLYDEQRRFSRYATLGGRYYFLKYLSVQLAFTYNHSEIAPTEPQWGIVGGIGASL